MQESYFFFNKLDRKSIDNNTYRFEGDPEGTSLEWRNILGRGTDTKHVVGIWK